MEKMQVDIYPPETEVYVINKNQVVQAVIEKSEINGFGHVTYGIRIQGRTTLFWLPENRVFTTLDDFVKDLMLKFQ